jgi:predicted RNA binding protein YcfA (HicA-like mRNA interferase family)
VRDKLWGGANRFSVFPEIFFLAFVTIFSYSLTDMGIEKDIARMKQNPKGVRFKELERIILESGFKRVNIRGSHHVYKKGEKILTIVKPHGGHKHCHWLDVKDTIKVLEED